MTSSGARPYVGVARPITRYGDPVLHRPCAAVTVFDDDLAHLVEDMFASMYAADGVGLAANQIGVSARVFVYDCTDESTGERQVGHVVNPVLRAPKGRRHLEVDAEGCLSVPGEYADLGRADIATVTGVDIHGAPVRVAGTGLLARCLQHEVDHLDGLVYVDRLSTRKRTAILAGMSSP
ncbi:MAG: peptide deformylase [Micromonosporaceae bacterium]|nr:peptide deformylase [Micromonosporaceae bacterium]